MDKRTPLLWLIPLTFLLIILNGGIPFAIILWIGYFLYASQGAQLVTKRDEKGNPTGKKELRPSSYIRNPHWYSAIDSKLVFDRKMTAWRREEKDWRGRLILDTDGTRFSDEILAAHQGDMFWCELWEL